MEHHLPLARPRGGRHPPHHHGGGLRRSAQLLVPLRLSRGGERGGPGVGAVGGGNSLCHPVLERPGGGGGPELERLEQHERRLPRGGTPDTRHPATYALHPTPYTLHPAPCTLHPATCTLHPTPYTLNPTPFTLHPTPYTVNPET